MIVLRLMHASDNQ